MNAREIFQTRNFDFEVEHPSFLGTARVYCTTEDAVRLQTVSNEMTVTAVHPEFLGWTIEEIEMNSTEE